METSNPYVGPRAFEEEDSRNFFGRDVEIRQLASLVIAHRVVLLYAPSGAGKTSLLGAGLIPYLKQRKRVSVLPICRVGGDLPPEVDGTHVENVYIFNTLLDIMGEETLPGDLVSLTLREGLASYATPQSGQRRVQPWLLIIDQFEELFTTHPERYPERADFFFQLQKSLTEYPQLSLLLSMREDYIAQLDSYAAQLPDRLRMRFRLELLGAEAARQAAREPAHRAGVDFTDTAAEQLINDLRKVQVQQPDGTTSEQLGRHIEPVQLQVVCRRLWEKLPENAVQIGEADIEAVGDVDSALADYYADRISVMAQQTGGRERVIREWFDRQLITGQGMRGQVLKGPEQSQGLENRAIDLLVDAHLVRAEKRLNAIWYELAHDRLIEPVRKSNNDWFQANLSPLQRQADLWESQSRSKGLLLRDEALKEAEDWAADHQDELTPTENDFLTACLEARDQAQQEQRKNRLISRLAIGMTIITVFVIIAAVFAFTQRQSAIQARNEADEAKKQAERQARIVDEARKQAERQVRIAKARQLAVQSQSALEEFPQRSLLLAIEALHVTEEDDPHVPAAEQALRDALAHAGGIGVTGKFLAMSPDSRWLVTGSEDGRAWLWDLEAPEPAMKPVVPEGYDGRTSQVAISMDSRWLVIGSHDGTARLWNLTANDPETTMVALSGYTGKLRKVAFSPDNHWLVTHTEDGTVQLWDVTTSEPSTTPIILQEPESTIKIVEISPDSRWLVTGSEKNIVRLWNLKMSHPAASSTVLPQKEKLLSMVMMSPDSHWLVIGYNKGGLSGTALLVDLTAENPAAVSTILQGQEKWISDMAISGNSRWLVIQSQYRFIRIWDLTVTEPAAPSLPLQGGSESKPAISPNSRWLIKAGVDSNEIYVWDLHSVGPNHLSPLILSGHEGRITCVTTSADSRWLVTGSDDSTVRLWDLTASDPAASSINLTGHEGRLNHLRISSDNRWLVTGSDVGAPRLWDLTAKELSEAPVVLDGTEGRISHAMISPDDRWVVIGTDSTVRVWDLHAEHPDTVSPNLLNERRGKVAAFTMSSDNHWLVTGSADGTARLWDLQAPGYAVHPIILHKFTRQITAAAISPDSHWLVIGSKDGTARLWDLHAENPAGHSFALRRHLISVSAVAFSANSRWLVTAGWADKTVYLWDLTVNNFIRSPVSLSGPKGETRSIAFSPDNRWLVTGSDYPDNAIWLWDLHAVNPAEPHIVLPKQEDAVEALALSPDGSWLVSYNPEPQTHLIGRLWDLSAKDPSTTSIPLCESKIDDRTTSVAFSPNNRWLVTGSRYNPAIRIWDLSTTQPADNPIIVHVPERGVDSLTISPNSRWLFTGSRDGTVRRWNLMEPGSTELSIVLRGHENTVAAMTISENGQWLATGSRDGIVRLWKLTEEDPSATAIVLPGHRGKIATMIFSPDNRWLMTYTADETAQLWTLHLEELKKLACRTAGRNLSYIEWDQYFRGEEYRVSCSVMPVHPNVITTARSLAETQDIKAAIAILQRAIESDPDLHKDPTTEVHNWVSRSLMTKGRQLASQGKVEDAIAAYMKARKFNPSLGIDPNTLTAQNLLTKGQQLAEQGEIEEAIAVYTAAQTLDSNLDIDPQKEAHKWQAQHLMTKGRSLARQRKIEDAIHAYTEAQTLDPTLNIDPRAETHKWAIRDLMTEGQWAIGRGKIQEAIKLFTEAKKLESDSDADPRAEAYTLAAQILINKGQRLAKRKEVKDAMTAYKNALELDPTLDLDPRKEVGKWAAQTLMSEGQWFAKQGKIEEAIEGYAEAKRLDSGLGIDPWTEAHNLAARSRVTKGRWFAERGKMREALAAYEKAQTLDSTLEISADSWNILCRNGSLWQYAVEVMPACEQAVMLASEYEKAIMRDSRGLARALTGDIDGAIEDFQASIHWLENKGKTPQSAFPLAIVQQKKAQRQRWIDALKADENPFTFEVLKRLRDLDF